MIYIQRTDKIYEGGGSDRDRPVALKPETIAAVDTYGEAAKLIRSLPAGPKYYTSTRPCREWAGQNRR